MLIPMRSTFVLLALFCLLAPPLSAQQAPAANAHFQLIGLGSCAKQFKPQPILNQVVARQPDLFIYLGDNIYGDTKKMKVLRRKYRQLARKPEFKRLVAEVPVLATWDDHDYGGNDEGREYPFKEESRDIFLDFWKVPTDAPRRQHAGIYDAQVYGSPGQQVQVILLDTRSFRDGLLPSDGKPWKNNYRPNESPDSTFLGAEQWAWLEAQLRVPADLRIIASSNQFSHTYNGWESWTNVPRERDRMIELIRTTRANGVVFISGDVHWGELSRQEVDGGYPLYDLTSSGITQTWPSTEPNDNRVGEVIRENNVGFLAIDWDAAEPTLTFSLVNVEGKTVLEHQVGLAELQWQ